MIDLVTSFGASNLLRFRHRCDFDFDRRIVVVLVSVGRRCCFDVELGSVAILASSLASLWACFQMPQVRNQSDLVARLQAPVIH